MASYEQQAEVLSKLNAFSDRNKTNFSKRDSVLHEINRHRENQASSIKFRKNLLESQKRSNYVNEYDRLRGSLHSGLVKDAPTIKHINLRMGKLKELASESIHGVKHDVFHDKTEEQLTDKERLAKVNKQLKQNEKGGKTRNTMVITPRDSHTHRFTHNVIYIFLFAIIYNYQNGTGCNDGKRIKT